MLKIRADNILILGLSAINLERLKAGQPIVFDGADVGLPELATIAILYGEDEANIAAALRQDGFPIPDPLPGLPRRN